MMATMSDVANLADCVQQRLARRMMDAFAPVHQASGGRDGWVSIQGNPHAEADPAAIIAAEPEGTEMSDPHPVQNYSDGQFTDQP